MQLLLVSGIFFVAAVLLLLHHGWKHAHEDPETSHVHSIQLQQDWCMELLLVSGSFFVVAVLLKLHHGVKHAREDPETSHAQQESCPEVCYFQPSDVCNFRTCNHEMWVIVFFIVLMVVGGIRSSEMLHSISVSNIYFKFQFQSRNIYLKFQFQFESL